MGRFFVSPLGGVFFEFYNFGFLAERLGVEGNHQFLVGGDAANCDLTVVSTQNGFCGATTAVLRLIHLDAHILQALRGAFAHFPLVLASSASKEDDIDASHCCGVCSDVLRSGLAEPHREEHYLQPWWLVCI